MDCVRTRYVIVLQHDPVLSSNSSWPRPALLPQIYPDPELEQQILALPIRCIHSEEGCRWTGQMKQLQVRSSDILFHFPFIFFPSMFLNTLTSPPGTCCRPPSPRLLQLSGGGLTNRPTSAGVCVILMPRCRCVSLRATSPPAPSMWFPAPIAAPSSWRAVTCPTTCSTTAPSARSSASSVAASSPAKPTRWTQTPNLFLLFLSFLLQHGGSLT